MQCPECKAFVGIDRVTTVDRDSVDEVEINFNCPGCGKDFYAVLEPDQFKEVA